MHLHLTQIDLLILRMQNLEKVLITDTQGNTITNPRWGFTDFKMVAECATGTLFVNQLYLYAGTELIAKFTPNASNEASIERP